MPDGEPVPRARRLVGAGTEPGKGRGPSVEVGQKLESIGAGRGRRAVSVGRRARCMDGRRGGGDPSVGGWWCRRVADLVLYGLEAPSRDRMQVGASW